jgi:ADP-ribosylglycohydrolase
MAEITLGRDEFRDRVYACWLGKNIGGTLGTPYECRKEVLNLTFYDPVPTEPLPNDDLDLQLAWLSMLEARGDDVCVADFAEYWKRHLSAYPWNEYGFCGRNLERGLMPPISGWFENYYVDEMGSPIRSEIWACVAPADPQRAAALAWMDSAMDHGGGEGMWGEMFWAAAESAAFVVSDPHTLIRIGLTMIPPACNIARVIREVVWMRGNGTPWAEARERIMRIYGNEQPCNAIQNHGFTVLGWLYGEDFGDRLCKAVNCGYDTDCTGATLGSLLGILGGTAAIPKKWSDPVGTSIRLHQFTRALDAPKDIEELTARTVAVTERLIGQSPQVRLGSARQMPAEAAAGLFKNELAVSAIRQDLRAAVARDGDMQITLHYQGDPVLHPGEARGMRVTCARLGKPVPEAQSTMRAPAEWQVRAGLDGAFQVNAPRFSGAERLSISVEAGGKSYRASFVVLSPEAAAGFASATNVEYCPTCHGRAGACICA